MVSIGKVLLLVGVCFLLLGGLFIALQKIGVGKLPGDIRIQHGNFSFFFPLTSCLLISIILTLILSFLFRK